MTHPIAQVLAPPLCTSDLVRDAVVSAGICVCIDHKRNTYKITYINNPSRMDVIPMRALVGMVVSECGVDEHFAERIVKQITPAGVVALLEHRRASRIKYTSNKLALRQPMSMAFSITPTKQIAIDPHAPDYYERAMNACGCMIEQLSQTHPVDFSRLVASVKVSPYGENGVRYQLQLTAYEHGADVSLLNLEREYPYYWLPSIIQRFGSTGLPEYAI